VRKNRVESEALIFVIFSLEGKYKKNQSHATKEIKFSSFTKNQFIKYNSQASSLTHFNSFLTIQA